MRPEQRISEELGKKINWKKLQDLYIHNMVTMEYIIWLSKMKMKEKKEKREKWISDLIQKKASKEFDWLKKDHDISL